MTADPGSATVYSATSLPIDAAAFVQAIERPVPGSLSPVKILHEYVHDDIMPRMGVTPGRDRLMRAS